MKAKHWGQHRSFSVHMKFNLIEFRPKGPSAGATRWKKWNPPMKKHWRWQGCTSGQVLGQHKPFSANIWKLNEIEMKPTDDKPCNVYDKAVHQWLF